MVTIKKIWAFIKNYWFIPIFVFIGYLFLKKEKTKSVVSIRKEAYRKEKEVIEATEELKVILKENRKIEYEKEMEEINKKYETKRNNIEKKIEKESKERMKDPENNIAKKIAEEFGVKYEE